MTQDRAKQLADVENKISQGEQHITYMRTLLAKLQRDGHDRAAIKAQALLSNLLDLQAAHEKDRASLRREPGPQ